MSLYALQKLIRDVNRNPDVRRRFADDPAGVARDYGLAPQEIEAVSSRDYPRLYGMGVHGLLLRPFSIIHGVSEPDYLSAIREGPS